MTTMPMLCPSPHCPRTFDDPCPGCAAYMLLATPVEAPILDEPPCVVDVPPVVDSGRPKRNQLCWVCEERRTCSDDPAHPGRWICRACEEVPA